MTEILARCIVLFLAGYGLVALGADIHAWVWGRGRDLE